MRVPVSWLRQLIKTDAKTIDIAENLTVAGIEVEDICGVGVYAKQVICGRLIEKQSVPDQDGVWQLRCDIGHDVIPLVAKSAQLEELPLETMLALARPGAHLLDQHGLVCPPLKCDKRYGFVSEAMLCSAADLGLSADDVSPLILSAQAKPGVPVLDEVVLPQDCKADEVLSLAILANIARCQSMWGVAREVAALMDCDLCLPLKLDSQTEHLPKLYPQIEDEHVCARLALLSISGIEVKASPQWMQIRLSLAGIRPINNVVDAGNYLMLAMGQPVHTYDLDKLETPALSVRLSREAETLHTITQTVEEAPMLLQAGHPLICCADKPVALAGVMGGRETAIGDKTQRLLLEVANFDMIAVRRSQAAHKLFTESSARFSRGVDAKLSLPAMAYFMLLIQETCPQAVMQALGDDNRSETKPRMVQLSSEQVQRTLGIALTASQMAALLAKVGLETQIDNDGLVMTAIVDSARSDIVSSCDLLEEVARLYGFDALPATMPKQPIPQHLPAPERNDREKARDAMVRCGLQEVISYHMTHPSLEAKLQQAVAKSDTDPAFVRLLNPASEERCVMRRSLLAGLLSHMAHNLRHTPTCQLFEIGRVFLPEISADSPLLPAELYRLTAVMTGPVHSANWQDKKPRAVNFFDLAAVGRALFASLNIHDLMLESANVSYLHPGSCARLLQAGKCYGHIGQVHPRVCEAFELTNRDVFALDLDLEQVVQAAGRSFELAPIGRYPSVELDISVEVDRSISAQWLLSTINKVGGTFLQSVNVFDVYQSEDLGQSKKSVALHLNFNGKNRTLTMAEAVTARDHIIEVLAEEFGAKLRDASL